MSQSAVLPDHLDLENNIDWSNLLSAQIKEKQILDAMGDGFGTAFPWT